MKKNNLSKEKLKSFGKDFLLAASVMILTFLFSTYIIGGRLFK